MMYVLCTSLCLGDGYQSTSCDCNLWKSGKIGHLGNEFGAIAFLDMAEDKNTRFNLT